MNIELTAEQIAQANKPPEPQREVQVMTTRRPAGVAIVVDDQDMADKNLTVQGNPGETWLHVAIGELSVRVDRAALVRAIGVFDAR